MEALFTAASAELPLSFIVIDDAHWRLRSLLKRAVFHLKQCRWKAVSCHSETALKEIETFINSYDCDALLVNAHLDLHPPGKMFRALLATYCGKAPFPVVVLAGEERVDELRDTLLRRGVDAVIPLSIAGVQRLPRHLETVWQLSSPLFSRPVIKPEALRSRLSHEQLGVLQSLFDEAEDLTCEEVGGKGAATWKLFSSTDKDRRYFVKIGRWDSLVAEYANYLDLIQGRHENYTGRVIGKVVIGGQSGALRFSLAGTGRAKPKVLRDFLRGASVAQGEGLLRGLKRRLVESRAPVTESFFRPQRFLRVLPALLTVQFDRFAGPGRREAPPNVLRFPPRDRSGVTTRRALREFLSIVAQTSQEVQVETLAIQEIRPEPGDGHGATLQLTDVQENGKPEIGYKVNIEIAEPSVRSSPKLHRGNRPTIVGSVVSTLDDVLWSLCSPLRDPCLSLGLEQWDPDAWLYDLLFGTKKEGDEYEDWQPSMLEKLQNVPVGDFVHGDFNLNNIIVEERAEERLPWLIDFEKSAVDFYPAADWAKLEVEMAIHLATEELFSTGEMSNLIRQIYEFEHALWCPVRFAEQMWIPAKPQEIREEPLRRESTSANLFIKTFHWQDTIRRLVAEELPTLTTAEFADYLFAVMCYSLQALRYASAPLGKYATYIKAAVACKRIDQILSEDKKEEA